MFIINWKASNARGILALLSLMLFIVVSCKQVIVEPVPWLRRFIKPSNFPEPVYSFENNKVTKAGFELGRELFYDPLLSENSTVSCGTCHKQFAAFADYQHTLSHGINNQFTTRNSPGIYNMAWSNSFMWDGGINHIEVMPIAPLTNPVEMDESLANIVVKLKSHESYPGKFKEAFGTDSITSKNMLLALAQFMGMIVSSESKFDKYQRGEQGGDMTDEALRGLTLFDAKCSGCHAGVLQTDQSFRNNGIGDNSPNDLGRYLITQVDADKGKFKVPSLRNVEITTPYMHDGRFETLEEVLDHYSSISGGSSTLDPSLVNGIAMSEEEKKQIISFLKTLTDHEFIKNEMFKEPIR